MDAVHVNNGALTDIVIVGNLCRDVVLVLPSFPREDGDIRITARSTMVGGNAANASIVLGQLIPSDNASHVRLVATLGDPESCSDTAACIRALGEAGIDASASVHVSGAALPVSTVLICSDTGSRTILSHRSMRDLTPDDCSVDDVCCSARAVHVEHRNTATAMRWLRAARAANCPVVSVELEKLRGSAATTASLVPAEVLDATHLCDVVVLGHDYCTAAARHDWGDAVWQASATEECPLQPPRNASCVANGKCPHRAALRLLAAAATAASSSRRALVVVPWGADGVLAAVPAGAGACEGVCCGGDQACLRCVREWEVASSCVAETMRTPTATLLASAAYPEGVSGLIYGAHGGKQETRCPGYILVHQPAVPCATVVDTRGAGDTFTAALLFAVIRAGTLSAANAAAALAFAATVASAKVGVHGLDSVGAQPLVVMALSALQHVCSPAERSLLGES